MRKLILPLLFIPAEIQRFINDGIFDMPNVIKKYTYNNGITGYNIGKIDICGYKEKILFLNALIEDCFNKKAVRISHLEKDSLLL